MRHQGAADDDVLRSDDRRPSCRRRASARTRARAATSPTRRATRSATWTCRRYAGVNRRRDLLLDYGPYQQPSLLVKNVPPYQVAGPALGRHDGRRHDRHQAHRRPDPRPDGERATRRCAAGSRTARPRTTPACRRSTLPHSRAAMHPDDADPPSAAGFDPNADPTTPDFATFTSERRARPQQHVRRRQLPRHARQRALPHVRRHAAGGPLELLRGRRSTSRRRPSRARSSGARSRPRRAAATTRAGRSSRRVQRPELPGLLQLGAAAHGAAGRRDARPGVPLLRAEGAADAREEGLHDGPVPLGGDVPRLPPPRRLGGQLLAHTRRARTTTFTVAQMSFESDDVDASRLVRKNLYRPEVVRRARTASPTAAARCFEDFGDAARERRSCATPANYDYDNGDRRHDPRVLRRPRVAQARARGAQPRAAHRDRLRQPAHPGGAGSPAGLRRLRGRRRACTSRRSTLDRATGAVTLGADTPVDLTGVRARERPRHPPAGRLVGRHDHRVRGARARASDPLAIYTMNADGTGCAKQPDIANHAAHGERPARARLRPGVQPARARRHRAASSSPRRAATSTRRAFDYSGPQRTPEDPPSRTPTSTSSSPTRATRRATASGSSPGSSTWSACRASCRTGASSSRPRSASRASTSSRSAGRTSTAATTTRSTRSAAASATSRPPYVVELADKNFATIFSNQDAQHGAGALGVFNRSIGVDFTSTNASDYLVDPTRHRPDLAIGARAAILPPLARRVAGERRLVHEPRRRCPTARCS